MGFQILNKDKQAISINDLDAEAVTFWEQEFSKENYATPYPHWGNWFDMIGFKIHHPIDPRYTSGWNNVKHNMFLVSVGGFYKHLNDSEAMNKSMSGVITYLKPYFALIDHWESKGYIPQRVED